METRKTTSTVTINAAFLQEIKEVNEELWKLLERTRQLCSDQKQMKSQGKQALELLGALRDQLAMHFALEEAYGYIENPVIVAPHLTQPAAILRDEHTTLYSTISELYEAFEGEHYAGRLDESAPNIVARFVAFDKQFRGHETRENELILQAYDDDIGVGD